MSPVTLLADFNVEKIYKHLGLRPDQILEREAVRFVYRHHTSGEDKSETRLIAADDTIDLIATSFDMLSYAENFFKKKPYDRAALTMAVLCDDLIGNATNLKQDENGDLLVEADRDMITPSPTVQEITKKNLTFFLYVDADDQPLRRDFTDDRAVGAASMLMDASKTLEEEGLKKGEVVPEEALFLSHINAHWHFQNCLAHLDEFDQDDLMLLRANKLRPARSFLRKRTDIGKELARTIEELDEAIEDRLPKARIYTLTPGGPHEPRGPAEIISLNIPEEDKFVADPVEYLLRHTPLQNDAVRSTLNAVWDTLFGIHLDDDIEAMKQADTTIEQRSALFALYEKDFGLSPQERETALCAWLAHDLVDVHDEDYWRFFAEKTIGILVHLDNPEYRYPVLSDSYGDRPLEFCLGLTMLMTLDATQKDLERHKITTYKPDERAETLTYIQRILNDGNPSIVESTLTHDILDRARHITQRLRGLARPQLVLAKH